MINDNNKKFKYNYPRPAITATTCIYDKYRGKFILIKRKYNPQKGKFGFPGGFMESFYPERSKGETIENAALREIKEETSLIFKCCDLKSIDIRSLPNRDPERINIVDIGFFICGQKLKPKHGDDAEEIKWVTNIELDRMILAFDHNILWDKVKKYMIHLKLLNI